jgi:hypothetical protein
MTREVGILLLLRADGMKGGCMTLIVRLLDQLELSIQMVYINAMLSY